MLWIRGCMHSKKTQSSWAPHDNVYSHSNSFVIQLEQNRHTVFCCHLITHWISFFLAQNSPFVFALKVFPCWCSKGIVTQSLFCTGKKTLDLTNPDCWSIILALGERLAHNGILAQSTVPASWHDVDISAGPHRLRRLNGSRMKWRCRLLRVRGRGLCCV